MLGFLWHYYACMEGKVYDITEWASCQVTVHSHFATPGPRQGLIPILIKRVQNPMKVCVGFCL